MLRDRLSEFGLAASLLTRLPSGRMVFSDRPMATQVWAYPVVGVVVGGIGAAALTLGRALGLPPMLVGMWALAAMVLATGALHEDGLADTADAFGGGATVARKLEIMRDSRIGSFGAAALILALALRGTALATITPAGLIAGAAASRAAMVVLIWLLRPAPEPGLAAGLASTSAASCAASLGVAVVLLLILLPVRPASAAAAAAVVAGLAMTWLGHRQIGGYTGDVCGATEQVAECLVFTVLALAH